MSREVTHVRSYAHYTLEYIHIQTHTHTYIYLHLCIQTIILDKRAALGHKATEYSFF